MLAIAALSLPRAAHAADGEPVRLDYDAPPKCPSAQAFFEALKARTTGLRAARPEEAGRTLRVHVTEAPTGMVARLDLIETDGSSTERSVDGSDCETIVSALALAAALGMGDPQPEPLAPPPPQPTERREPRRAAEPERGAPIRGSAGVALDVLDMGLPGGVFAPSVFGDVSLDSPRLFAPLLRVALFRGAGGSIATAEGPASFTWLFGRAEACPIRFAYGSFAVRPCVSLDAGALSGSALGAANGPTRDRPWVAVNVAARAEWLLVQWLRIDLGGGLGAPAMRDTFVVQSDPNVYQAPRIFPSAHLGVGAVFP